MIVKEITYEDGMRVTEYKCKQDQHILLKEYENGAQVILSDCQHYIWESVGNGCYPFPMDPEICQGVDEIAQKSIKKVFEGLTVWFLVPSQS